jgi:uncharacterized protein YukE
MRLPADTSGGATSVSALAPFSHDWIGGDIRGLSATAGTLYGYVPQLSAATSALDSEVEGLIGAAGWTGSAASAFERQYQADAEAANGLAALIEDAGEIIDALAVALSRIESDLEQGAGQAKQHGAPIGADGSPAQVCLAATTPAEKEASAWLEWYQKYYAECLSAAQKIRSEAAADLNGLPLSGIRPQQGQSGGSGWETALVAIGTGIDDIVGAGQGGLTGIGRATTKASALLRAGDPDGGRIMSLLSHNDTWQELGELGRSDAVELGGKFLLGVGGVLTGIGIYQQTHNVGEAAVDAAGDTAISWGATLAGTEGGAEIGMAAGTFVGPVGTLIGGGVGAIVGAGVGFLASDGFNHLVGDIFSGL